jgi:uncharacterized membrane protein YkoI
MIKKIALLGILISSLACGNENQEKEEAEDQEVTEVSDEKAEVSDEIKTALNKAYPNATEIEWDKEGNDFEASFENGDEELSVVFDAIGNILETEKEIEFSELPEVVKVALEGEKVSEAAIITKNGKTFYEAEVAGKDLIFDENGKPAKL